MAASDTNWCDNKITSCIIICKTQITTKLVVQRVEYLTEIPSVWPVPHISTAFLVDLQDPKFDLRDNEGDLYRPDALIKNKVNCVIPCSSICFDADTFKTESRFMEGLTR
jgi:hypothetical protein